MIIPFFSFANPSFSRLAETLKSSLLYVHTGIFNDGNDEIVGFFRKEDKKYVIRKAITLVNSNVTSIPINFNAENDILLSINATANDKTNIYTLDNDNFLITVSDAMLNISFSDIKNTNNIFDIAIEIKYGVLNAN